MNERQAESIRRRVCGGRVKYGPVAARNQAASARIDGKDLHPYRCPFCGCWHLGHPMSWNHLKRLAAAIRHRAYPEGGHIERAS